LLFRQRRRDLVFLYWPTDPFEVARLLPAGTVPDLHQSRAYVGLVFFRMDDLAFEAEYGLRPLAPPPERDPGWTAGTGPWRDCVAPPAWAYHCPQAARRLALLPALPHTGPASPQQGARPALERPAHL
jgi:hypothetical protein